MDVSGLGLVVLPDGRRQRVPLVRREDDVLVSGFCVRTDHRPRHAVVVDHAEGAAVHTPGAQDLRSAVGAAAHLLHAVGEYVVAGNAGAEPYPARPDIAAQHFLRGLGAPVGGIVLPEPSALHDVPVAVVLGTVLGLVAELRSIVEELFAVVTLMVLRVVQTDIGVRRLHHEEGPFARFLPEEAVFRAGFAGREHGFRLSILPGRREEDALDGVARRNGDRTAYIHAVTGYPQLSAESPRGGAADIDPLHAVRPYHRQRSCRKISYVCHDSDRFFGLSLFKKKNCAIIYYTVLSAFCQEAARRSPAEISYVRDAFCEKGTELCS